MPLFYHIVYKNGLYLRIPCPKIVVSRGAEAAYRKAIEIHPDNGWAWTLLGHLLHTTLERYEEAEAAYRKAVEINSANHLAWANKLGLKLKLGLAPLNEILKLAENRSSKYSESAELHNSIAWTFFENAPRSHLLKALVWARKSVELAPRNPDYEHTLASILAVIGCPEEALKHTKNYIKDRLVVERLLEDWINLFINIAAAGCPREALEVLQDLPSIELMEPLIVGLHLFLEEDVKAPVEVLEVAKDVKKRIEGQREKLKD